MQIHYLDSSPISRSSSPVTTNTAPFTKLAPSVSSEAPVPPEEPYRDEPSASSEGVNTLPPRPQRYHTNRVEQPHFPPYTDAIHSARDSDDIPLAYLYPYPTEAPPAYSIAVRQSYQDTLISHIPSNSTVSAATDEEGGVEREYPNDGRYSMERTLARFIVAIFIFLLSGILFSIAVFSMTSFQTSNSAGSGNHEGSL